MKIKLFGITISTRKKLYKRLVQGYARGYNNTIPHTFYYVMGCYDSHWFGICVYRNKSDVSNVITIEDLKKAINE